MAVVVKNIVGFNPKSKCNFSQIFKELWRFSSKNGHASLQPSLGVQHSMPFVTCSYLAKKREKKSWQDLPYPELQPADPEDYKRWRTFARYSRKPIYEPNFEFQDEKIPQEIFQRINQQILTGDLGRLFAVVQIGGKQFKITSEDIIIVQGYFPPTIGDEIRLEKILLVGSKDFTIVGKPLLNKDLLRVEASVIEKTLSQVITHFRMKRRQQYRRTYFMRQPFTMLRINNIKIRGLVDELKETDGLEDHIIS